MTEPRNETWMEMGRTQAVRLALLERGESSLDELVTFLTTAGRSDPKPLVSAALAGLKKSGWAHSVGHGRWAPGTGERVAQGEPSAVPRPGAPRRGSEDYHEYWDCSKGCGHVNDSPQPLTKAWHTNCKKAKQGDWIPMTKREA